MYAIGVGIIDRKLCANKGNSPGSWRANLWFDGCVTFLFRQKHGGKGKAIFLCLDLACRRPYFSLLRQRKGEQKKGEPKAVPLRGTLRYSRRAGSCANSLRSDKRPLSRPCVCIRTKPHSTDYNCDVPQCRHPNPHRKIPHQHPYPAQKKQNWLFRLPFAPRGGEGAGGKRGKNKASTKKEPTHPASIHYNRLVPQCRHPNPHRNLTHQHPYPNKSDQIGCSCSPSPRRG